MNASPANFGSFNVKNKLHTFINFRSIPRASAAGVRRLYPRMFFFSPKDACVKLRIGFHIYKKKGGAVNHPLIYTASSNCQVFFYPSRAIRRFIGYNCLANAPRDILTTIIRHEIIHAWLIAAENTHRKKCRIMIQGFERDLKRISQSYKMASKLDNEEMLTSFINKAWGGIEDEARKQGF